MLPCKFLIITVFLQLFQFILKISPFFEIILANQLFNPTIYRYIMIDTYIYKRGLHVLVSINDF